MSPQQERLAPAEVGLLLGVWRLALLSVLGTLAWLVHRAELWREVAEALVLAGGLLAGWKAVRAVAGASVRRRRLLGYTLQELDGLSGDRFQDWVGAMLARGGLRARPLGRSRDYGVDLIVDAQGCRMAVQAKRYDRPVGNGAVQQAIAGADYHRCEAAAVVTQSRFTDAARRQAAAAHLPVALLGRDELPRLCSLLRAAAGRSR
jgi:hypothetical protein